MPGSIRSMQLEHVLRNVQTDRSSLLHGRLLRWQFDTVTLAHRCRRGASTPSPADGSTIPRIVQFTPRLLVNSVRAAVASAVEGRGVTRPLSYQVAEHVRDGRLQVVLRSDEYAPLPVHIVTPEGRLSVPKVRAFVDFAVPRLRAQFARLTVDAGA
jgi:DNA-binding transcriptional LysR family regulator